VRDLPPATGSWQARAIVFGEVPVDLSSSVRRIALVENGASVAMSTGDDRAAPEVEPASAGKAAPREIELKLEVDPRDLPALRRHPLLRKAFSAPAGPRELLSTYFDTSDQRLRKAGLTLRLRQADGTTIQTVKRANRADAGLFDRSEWEGTVAGDAPDLAAAAETALAPLLAEEGVREGLAPMFAVSSKRSSASLSGDGWSVEMTLDDGAVEGAGRREIICEVELELQTGSPRDLFRLARELAEQVPLRLGIRTKADRGYALIGGEGAQVVKSIEPGVGPQMTAAATFQAIARACLKQLVANEAALLQAREPGAVHQMRVAIRRLRAAISLFKDVVDDKQRARVAAELKWMAKTLSDARDLDVFIDKEVAPIRARRPRNRDAARLVAHFATQRDAAYDAALATLGTDRYRLMLIDTAAWIEAGPWLAKSGRKIREAPIGDFAAEELARRTRRIRKKGRRISRMKIEDRHELRIAVKKLRYAAEFFAPVFAGKREKAAKRAEKFIRALEGLQERLGDLNDAATSAALSQRLDRTDPGQLRAARLLEHDDTGRAAQAMADARKAYGTFAKAKPFWD
jgi:triphosphatase